MSERNVVLVVDDDGDFRDLVCEAIGAAGLHAIGFRDGDTALRYLRHVGGRSTLLVLDLLMPAPDGWQVLWELKRDPALREVPVIIASAAADQQSTLRLAGIAGFLAKPFDPSELLTLLGRHGARRRIA